MVVTDNKALIQTSIPNSASFNDGMREMNNQEVGLQ